MCGIIGLFKYKQITDVEETIQVISKMLVECETRGTDATGIAIINSDTNKIEVYKKPLRARDFVKTDEWKEVIRDFGTFNIILGHTRNATHGDPENPENNHPFFNKKENVVMIHNGIISNHRELYEKHKMKQVGECDSSIILDLFCKTKNINEPIKQIRGGMAFTLYHDEKLYLFRNSYPLFISFDNQNKTFYFASELDFITKSLTKKHLIMGLFPVYETAPKLLNKDFESDELVTINFAKRRAYSRIVNSYRSSCNYFEKEDANDFVPVDELNVEDEER